MRHANVGSSNSVRDGRLACLWKACEVQRLHLPTSAAQLISNAGRSGSHVDKGIVVRHRGQRVKRWCEGFPAPAPAVPTCLNKLTSDLEDSWHRAASNDGSMWSPATEAMCIHNCLPPRMHLPRGVKGSEKTETSTCAAAPAHGLPQRGC